MDKRDIVRYLEDRSQDFYDLSDKIWENAEIRFTESQSMADMSAFVEREGFRVTRGVAGLDTAFIAEFGEGKPVIGFLGEYDALPDLSQKSGVAQKDPVEAGGNGHGCGHNLLGVGALMGAVGLKHYLEETGQPGTVMFFGCPAEEGGSGKTFMAREGCFDKLDCAFSWHPSPSNIMLPGTVLANCMIRYSFTGTTSHAAASPEMGRSALDALELMNVGIQFLREHVPSSVRIHYAITDTGGISPNIVQAHASGLYQIRAPHAPMVADVKERLNDIARGAALMTGTEVQIEFLKGTSNTVLIPALDAVAYKNMCELPNPALEASDLDFAREIVETQVKADALPDFPLDLKPKPYNPAGNIPFPGSSDTGDVSWVCPLCQFGVTTWPAGTTPHTWQVVACGKSDFAHRGMLFAGQIIAATAIDTYNDPELLKKAQEQFKEKTGHPYQCPIPENITPAYLAEALASS
ncbi:MAG: amidohydrolase [Eggerthellaceae bacterium]